MAGADDLSQSIRRLRVVRSFLPDPVSPDDMAAVLEAGRWIELFKLLFDGGIDCDRGGGNA